MYEYNAIVVSVYDGDTITVDWDLGAGIWKREEKLRLYGIDAPELRGPGKYEGLKSRDYLRDLLPVGAKITIKTNKDRKEKYGRYLATVWLGEINVNSTLVENGYAEFKEY